MVKPIVCKFKYYHVQIDFICCNKFCEIGVFTDFIDVKRIRDIEDKLRTYHNEYGATMLYAIVKVSRVYEEGIIRFAYEKEYNLVNPGNKIPVDYVECMVGRERQIWKSKYRLMDFIKNDILKNAFDYLKDKTFVDSDTGKTFKLKCV